MDSQILLKFGTWVHYEYVKAAQCVATVDNWDSHGPFRNIYVQAMWAEVN